MNSRKKPCQNEIGIKKLSPKNNTTTENRNKIEQIKRPLEIKNP